MLEQTASKNEPPTSDLARLALAENYSINGDTEKAISLYQELLTSSRNLKPAVEVGLGRGQHGDGPADIGGGADHHQVVLHVEP